MSISYRRKSFFLIVLELEPPIICETKKRRKENKFLIAIATSHVI